LPGQFVAEASWIGSAGHHLVNISNVNRYAGHMLDNRFDGFNPSFLSIKMARTTSNSIYNGGGPRFDSSGRVTAPCGDRPVEPANHQFEPRTSVRPESVTGSVRQIVRDVLKTAPVTRVTTLAGQVGSNIIP
jgi:hypothetical protein